MANNLRKYIRIFLSNFSKRGRSFWSAIWGQLRDVLVRIFLTKDLKTWGDLLSKSVTQSLDSHHSSKFGTPSAHSALSAPCSGVAQNPKNPDPKTKILGRKKNQKTQKLKFLPKPRVFWSGTWRGRQGKSGGGQSFVFWKATPPFELRSSVGP